jgi:hypothetical protein
MTIHPATNKSMTKTLMMTYKKYLAGALLIACPSLLVAANLEPFTSSYAASMHGLPIGNITRSLSIQNGHYQFISDTKSTLPFTNIEMRAESTGNWTNNGPQPIDYEYSYKHFHKIKKVSTHFDWAKHIATTIKHGKREQVTIHKGDQDKLSYQLAIRHDLLNNKRPLTYRIADGHNTDTYIFGQTGTDTIQTHAGDLQTIKMQRTNTGPNSENIIFWLAPKDGYAIAKIIDINDGKTQYSGVLKNYQTQSS